MANEEAGKPERQTAANKKVGHTQEFLFWLLAYPTTWSIVAACIALCVFYLKFEERMAKWPQGALGFSLKLLHSPNFWTGLGALGTIITLFVIYKQIAGARNVSAYQFLGEHEDRFRSPEMRRRRSSLARVILANPGKYDLWSEHADYICDYFEDLGLMLKRGIAPKYLTWSKFDRRILRYWQLLSPYVLYFRREQGDPTYYNDFEYLWKKIARFEKNKLKRNHVDVEKRILDEFLHEELMVDLRRFRIGDLGRVMEIERSSFDVDAYTENQFQELYTKCPGGFRVAEISDFVVAYIAVTVLGDVGEIDSMAVDPYYRRLRIGRQLLEFALLYFKTEHPELKLYKLQVRTNNRDAILLYEKLGFRTTQTLKDYYKDHADAFEMERQAVEPIR